MAARGVEPSHTRTCSRSEARRTSPMPGHLAELLDRAEAAVLLAVVEDLLRGRRADARQLVELLERGGVEVQRDARLCRRRRPAGGRRRPRDPAGDDDLAAVLDLGGEVDLRQVGPRRGAAGAADRVVDPGAGAHPVDAGLADRARHVHDDATRRRRVVIRDGDRGCGGRRRLGPAARHVPAAEHEQGDQRETEGGQLAGRDFGHGTTVWRDVPRISTRSSQHCEKSVLGEA